jgi:hypothetical protein
LMMKKPIPQAPGGNLSLSKLSKSNPMPFLILEQTSEFLSHFQTECISCLFMSSSFNLCSLFFPFVFVSNFFHICLFLHICLLCHLCLPFFLCTIVKYFFIFITVPIVTFMPTLVKYLYYLLLTNQVSCIGKSVQRLRNSKFQKDFKLKSIKFSAGTSDLEID